MTRKAQCLVIGAASLWALSGPTPSAGQDVPETGLTAVAPGVKKIEAVATFAKAVFACLGTRFDHKTLAELPPELAGDFQPASAADRNWAGTHTAQTPVWVTKRLGHIVVISEPSLDQCEVWATQLPVEPTLAALSALIEKTYPQFKRITLKPGYDPVVGQYELVDHDIRYVVHMEGAEPGAPGHALRFSLLFAKVIRQPASEPPPFR